jgi:SAM-dependent methyltransferase
MFSDSKAVPSEYLKAEFEKRGPWQTKFVIDGEVYGGHRFVAEDARIAQFLEAFPEARTILDLGALEGGHAFAFANLLPDARIVAIEGRPANIERAHFIKSVTGAENVHLLCENIEELSFESLGRFDAIFCCGILYHLPKPWELLEKLSTISSQLFLWTHYARETEVTLSRHGYRGREYKEQGLEDPYSGLSPSSFWPTLKSLHEMLEHARFSSVRIIKDDPSCPPGPAVILTATQKD